MLCCRYCFILESFYFIYIATFSHFSFSFEVPTCKSRGDFLFLLDASASIEDAFNSEAYFVKRFAQSMNETSRSGVILFGDSAVNSIRIDEHRSTRHFIDLVRRLRPIGSITRIDKGLLYDRYFISLP